jgi:hypothetical protein
VSQERELLAHVTAYLREHYYLGHGMPEGLRLELHPLAANLLYTSNDIGWTTEDGTKTITEMLAGKFGVPVVLSRELPTGTWRLAIVTEEVLDGGELWPARPAVLS